LDLSFYPGLTAGAYALALVGAFSLGFSKTGFPGLAMVNVLIMADVFGAKESVGIILPLLIVCDLIVYPLFRQFASWKPVWPLMIPAIVGVFIGWQLLGHIDNPTARKLIGGIILLMVALQLFRRYRQDFLAHLPDSRSFLLGSGLSIGVSTTLANAAGPVYSIYALVHKLPKNEFLGIGARFFLFMNIFKVPFNAELGILNPESLRLDLALLPGIFLGIFLGKRLIEKIPQQVFEVLLYLFSGIAGVRLLFF
jgi:uncharacterized membrane protein YfcA